ncbi:glycerol-3-phosphate dehydrogenase/oxidase [Bryobacter aggregatus]|uniref:glycerol-3-phosphate dehydrogenase/oxidase n=1 Tax=Bryobacter aggregatus TaxID=360054 RepID=UPI0006925613|nr:glycerol-3-phosphate dehydrogenase/oxidase [Bryobacter aggregatus]
MHSIEELAGQHFDAIIVGGGINGAGLARDLALRAHMAQHPMRVLLLEKRFWGAGTSGRNSHLIHGGLRYLKYFDFALVREALRERATLLQLAPHTVRPLRFRLSTNGVFDNLFYGVGIILYDLLAGSHRIGKSTYFGPNQAYWDAASDSAALVIDNVRDARFYGATCITGRAVKRLWGDGIELDNGVRVNGAAVIDARGPWNRGETTRLVRGSHLILPRLFPGEDAVAHFHHDGRIIFFIPWGDLNPVTLIGTTDVDHSGSADQVQISRGEIDYLRGIAKQLFPASADMETLGCFSSLRPLLAAPGKSASATSREHHIAFREDQVLEIIGGKYTTYRSMAEEAADLVCGRIAPNLVPSHPTRSTPFAVPTERPGGIPERIAWAKQEEGCETLEDFLTCSTNWAWQKRWTAEELESIAREFSGGVDAFLERYAPCD